MKKIFSPILAFSFVVSMSGFLAITPSASAACYVDKNGAPNCITTTPPKPKKDINIYNFALYPELHQPSGTTNLAKPNLAKPIPEEPKSAKKKDGAESKPSVPVVEKSAKKKIGMGGLSYSN